MHGWIEPFYVASQEAIAPGEIWCGDRPIHLPPRHGLKITRVDPEDDRKLRFAIGGRTSDTFDHPPVHSLQLDSTEAIVVAKARRDRPAIILGGRRAGSVQASGDDATPTRTAMVVPVYGADELSEQLRRRIARYDFTNLFYLPAYPKLRFEEGFARLDQAQPVDVELLGAHRGLRLASDALDALVEWYVAYATDRAPADSIIADYRREMRNADSAR